MDDQVPIVAPGWYDAGVASQQRWWNGVEWTAQVRPAPFSEKWDRPGWGAHPEAMVAIAVVSGVMFIGVQAIVLGLLFSGEYLRSFFGFVVSLGLPAFAVIAVISARIGFRRMREGRPAAGESPR